MIPLGSDATLAVKANDGDSFQWLRNGVPIQDQTKPSLVIPKVKIKDAGNYSCVVSKGLQAVASRAASLLVYIKGQAGNSITASGGATAQPMGGGSGYTIFGLPISSAGSSGSCPGSYAGYVSYSLTLAQGWGWSPLSGTTTYTAADGGGRSDTTVQYCGDYGDSGCDQTSVTIPHPAFSGLYRFVIYFPANVPATNYPIVLTGFNP